MNTIPHFTIFNNIRNIPRNTIKQMQDVNQLLVTAILIAI